MSRLNSMMDQYEKNSTPSTPKKNKFAKYDEKNYFGTRLDKGVNSAQHQIRVISESEEASPFTEVHIHKKKLDGKFKTFPCPLKEKGLPCPFCEARNLLLANGSEDARKSSYEYAPKLAYIAKVIDRSKPEEGVKIWRFNHHYKNAGALDKIAAANGSLPEGEDPFSNGNTGRDMIISVTRDDKASIVSGVNYNMTQTPLSENEEELKGWIAEAIEKNWESVYPISPYDKLEIIVRGGTPIFVKDDSERGGKFVDKETLAETPTSKPDEEFDSEINIGSASTNEEVNTTTTTPESIVPESATPEPVVTTTAPAVEASTETPVAPAPSEDEDDDLPF